MSYKLKLVRPVSKPIDEDIVPIRRLSAKFNCATSPLTPQLTPDHATDPVPQGYEVAILPLQFQPDKDEGQFVMPSLKEHRALASIAEG